MNILALDLSTKSSGWATKVDGKLESGCLVNSSTTIEKRIGYMRDEVLKLIEKYNIELIIAEEVTPENAANSLVGNKLNWLHGCIRIAVYEKYGKKIKIETLMPNTWRSKIGIHTGRGIKRELLKTKDIEYVKNKYNITVNDDEADAIGLYDAYASGCAASETKVDKSIPEQSAF